MINIFHNYENSFKEKEFNYYQTDLENNYLSNLIKLCKYDMKEKERSSLSLTEKQMLMRYIDDELRKINKADASEFKKELTNMKLYLNIK